MFCDHSLTLREMTDNLPTSGHFWTPPASFRVNYEISKQIRNMEESIRHLVQDYDGKKVSTGLWYFVNSSSFIRLEEKSICNNHKKPDAQPRQLFQRQSYTEYKVLCFHLWNYKHCFASDSCNESWVQQLIGLDSCLSFNSSRFSDCL